MLVYNFNFCNLHCFQPIRWLHFFALVQVQKVQKFSAFYCQISQYNRRVRKHRDDELEEFFTSILLEVLQDDTASPTSPPLLAPSSGYLVQARPTSCSAWRTRTATKTRIEAPTTGHRGLKHGKNSMELQCHYVRQVLLSWTWFCKISLLSWRRMGQNMNQSPFRPC